MMRAFALVLALFFVWTAPARAHDARPFSINIEEQRNNAYLVRLRVPPTVAFDNRPIIHWPRGCRSLNRPGQKALSAESETVMIACSRSLEGQALDIRYPIYNPSLPTLFRYTRGDGAVITQLLGPDQLGWRVPARPSWGAVALSYTRLGIEHIWTGIDHLLFVTGLLILAGSRRRVLLAVTGFTVAHSITLSLSVLGWLRLPVPPVETAIALSILFLAREIARPDPEGLARRYPIAVSSSFGLLHGFGFAAALREAGLPTGELATGLLCFNLGVEIGQVAFIVLVLGLYLGIRGLIRGGAHGFLALALNDARIAGYLLGLPAGYWFIERLTEMA